MVSGKRRRAGFVSLLVMTGSSLCVTARAEQRANPTANDLRVAAERFDEGRAAFKAGAYAEAAEHFEAADSRAPSASALGLAMRSRAEAGQSARAATLAELILRRHSDDSELAARAKATIEAATAETGRIAIGCDPACDLVVDDKLIHGRASEHWTLYLDAGDHLVTANWTRDRVAAKQVSVSAGEAQSLSFKPIEPEAEEVDPVPAESDVPKEGSSPPVTDDLGRSRGLSPVYFWVGLGTTAALGGATIWSGIDTLNNPGPAAVRTGCVGQGESCSLYRDGQRAELRTNVLIGATAAFALATAVTGIFFTDFSHNQPARDARVMGARVRPLVLALPEPSVRGSAGGAHLMTVIGAEGRF